jgi:hypothetical protein
VCLSATVAQPVHVWSGSSTALLELAQGSVKPPHATSDRYRRPTPIRTGAGPVLAASASSTRAASRPWDRPSIITPTTGPPHVPAGIDVTAWSATSNTGPVGATLGWPCHEPGAQGW